MVGKIYTMIGGKSLPFDPSALDILNTFLKSKEYDAVNTRSKFEQTIADSLVEFNKDMIKESDVYKVLARFKQNNDSTIHSSSQLNSTEKPSYYDWKGSKSTPNDIYRSFAQDRPMFTGTAIFFAKKFNVDVRFIRGAFILLTLFQTIGIFAYGIAYAIMKYLQSDSK